MFRHNCATSPPPRVTFAPSTSNPMEDRTWHLDPLHAALTAPRASGPAASSNGMTFQRRPAGDGNGKGYCLHATSISAAVPSAGVPRRWRPPTAAVVSRTGGERWTRRLPPPGVATPGNGRYRRGIQGPYGTGRQSVAHAATGHDVLWKAARAGSSPATTTPYSSAALHAEERTTKAAAKQIARGATGGAA